MHPKLLTSKKSQTKPYEVLYWVGHLLILVGVIFLPLFAFANSVGSSSEFDKNFIARDLALFIDAVQSLDSDAVIEYPAPKEIKTFELKHNLIRVGTKDDSKPVAYLILAEKSKAYEPTLLKESKITLADNEVLVIKKQGKIISIEQKIKTI